MQINLVESSYNIQGFNCNITSDTDIGKASQSMLEFKPIFEELVDSVLDHRFQIAMKQAFSDNLLDTSQVLINDPYVKDGIAYFEYSEDAPYIPVAPEGQMQVVVTDESL